jgi:hypothetical protein
MSAKSIIPAALLALVLACGGGGSDDFDDQGDNDSNDDQSEADAMTLAAADAMDWGSSMVYVTTDPFEDPAEMSFTPEGCARAQSDGAELTYELTECVGPVGHVIDGALRMTFSEKDGATRFDLASDDLRIDGRNVEFSLDGVYRATASGESVLYTSAQRLAGSPDALRASFETELGWTDGSDCLTRNATGQLAVGDLAWVAEVDGYERCADECPGAGTLTVRDANGASVLTFDGSSSATLHRQDGNAASVALDCGR